MIKRAKQKNSSEFCDFPYISLYITVPEVPISQSWLCATLPKLFFLRNKVFLDPQGAL